MVSINISGAQLILTALILVAGFGIATGKMLQNITWISNAVKDLTAKVNALQASAAVNREKDQSDTASNRKDDLASGVTARREEADEITAIRQELVSLRKNDEDEHKKIRISLGNVEKRLSFISGKMGFRDDDPSFRVSGGADGEPE